MIALQIILILLFAPIVQVVNAKEITKKQPAQCDISFNKIELCAQINFITPPNRKKSSDFKLRIFDSKLRDKAVQKYQVLTWLWMDMKGQEGHGSDAIKLTQKNDHYLGTNVWFLMEGDWELHVQLRKEGKIISQGKKIYCVEGRKHKCSATQNH